MSTSTSAQSLQLDSMRQYMTICSTMMEPILKNLMLQQPEDPHTFVCEALKSLSQHDRSTLHDKIAAHAAKREWTPVQQPDAIQLIITYQPNPGHEIYEKIISVLKELKNHAQTLPACTRFDVVSDPSTSEIVTLQRWTTQSGLDGFRQSAALASAQHAISGLLSGPASERVYVPA